MFWNVDVRFAPKPDLPAGLETFSSSPDNNGKRRLRTVLIRDNMYFLGLAVTIEWKDTDYDVVGDGVPVGRISAMSGAIFSLD
jgi:hypothetical protein